MKALRLVVSVPQKRNRWVNRKGYESIIRLKDKITLTVKFFRSFWSITSNKFEKQNARSTERGSLPIKKMRL
jgi:hypothetical protein